MYLPHFASFCNEMIVVCAPVMAFLRWPVHQQIPAIVRVQG